MYEDKAGDKATVKTAAAELSFIRARTSFVLLCTLYTKDSSKQMKLSLLKDGKLEKEGCCSKLVTGNMIYEMSSTLPECCKTINRPTNLTKYVSVLSSFAS